MRSTLVPNGAITWIQSCLFGKAKTTATLFNNLDSARKLESTALRNRILRSPLRGSGKLMRSMLARTKFRPQVWQADIEVIGFEGRDDSSLEPQPTVPTLIKYPSDHRI